MSREVDANNGVNHETIASTEISLLSDVTIPQDLDAIAQRVRGVASTMQGESHLLLALLRLLEMLHREIREGLFQSSLPENRQALYALLRDIETNGGWPYINRMKLQEFLRAIDNEAIAPLPIERAIAPSPLPTAELPTLE